MTPSVSDLRAAPELAVLHALDAALVAALRALRAQHPTLGHDFMPDGYRLPVLCTASLVHRDATALRRALRRYRVALAVLLRCDDQANDDDIPF